MSRLGLLTMLVLVGCTQPALYEGMYSFENREWAMGDRTVHTLTVTDTVSLYDVYLNLRIGTAYPYANMYLFVTTGMPDGRSLRDTVECILADRTGRWLGDGLGDIRDNRILFKPQVRFPQSGTYTFALEHGMRTETLPEVYDAGIGIYPSSR